MTITEAKQALGDWSIRLRADTPREVLDQLQYFGHVAVLPGRLDPEQYGDALLSAARYVGVHTGRGTQDQYEMSGQGMALWLGDADGKGAIFETPVNLTNATFADSVRALLPASGSVTEGTLHNVTGSYTGKHQWQSPREAITYVCGIFSSSTDPAEWRVNGDGTLDAGKVSDLYRTDPAVLLVKKGLQGRELDRVALPGNMALTADAEDYSTRVVVLAEGEGGSIATGAADALAVPYKDLHGNPVELTRLVSSAETTGGNADAVAQLQLNRFTNPRQSATLSTADYDVTGDLVVGDYLAVYDPDVGYADDAHEWYWRGLRIHPTYLRCVELTWPVREGWTVAYRTGDGAWIDLSRYYIPESGQTTVKVGELDSALTSLGFQPIGTRPIADSSVPAAPTFTGFSTGAYQGSEIQFLQSTIKAAIRAQWSTPLNQDGSTVLDGDHYEIRYRVSAVIGYPVDWDTLASYSWDDLGTWDALISEPVTEDPQWQTAYVAWGTNAFTIAELTPGVEYELQIAAVDAASPPNRSPWSASEFVTTTGDLIPPSTPAAPVVATSQIALQVVHTLGKNSGGTYNLEPDLHHLDVHIGPNPTFVPTLNTKVGEMIANAGMMSAGIAAIGTFRVDQTSAVYVKVVAVDASGNTSGGSPAATGTVTLIDNAHISDLSVSKLTAGTITAAHVLAAQVTVGTGGDISLTEGSVNVWQPAGDWPVVEMGKTSFGEYGLLVQEPDGDPKAFIGQFSDSFGTGYGLALTNSSGDLVKLDSFIFGPQIIRKNTVGSFVFKDVWSDLSDGLGPYIVGVPIGDLGRCIVTLTGHARAEAAAAGETTNNILMGLEVLRSSDNLTVVEPDPFDSLTFLFNDFGEARASVEIVVDGLTPGVKYSFVARYLLFDSGGNTGMWSNRTIKVQPY